MADKPTTRRSNSRKKSSLVERSCRSCFNASSYELKDLDLANNTELLFPGRRWGNLNHMDQVEVIRSALRPKAWLIDPHCSYMKYWDVLIILSLTFMGIVTPYEVIFVGPLRPDNWLFVVNRIVDAIFLKDMILQFFLKVYTVPNGKKGRIVLRDPWTIRRRYLSTWFVIDLIGVMQFDLFFMYFEGSEGLSGIKFLRMVRLLRLMKLIRMLRGSRALNRWQNYFTVSFAAQKLIKFTFGLLLCSHWMACAWGLVGFSLGQEMCDLNGNRIITDTEVPLKDVSWVTTLYEDKRTPDDPCSAWHVYCAALYWAVMTITSIGYGDIVPVRGEEYLACVICMLLGGVVWANIIGGTCAVIARGDPVQDRFEANTDLLNAMMEDSGIPKDMQYCYREYLREARAYDTHSQFRGLAKNFSPVLKGQLLMHMSRSWVRQVPFLKKASDRCTMALAENLEMRFFARKERLDISSDKLCINERGTVARGGSVVPPGGVFHLDFIVTNPRLRKREESIALNYALVMTMEREGFLEIVGKQPEVYRDTVWASMVFAVCRCITLCAKEYKKAINRYGKDGMRQLSWAEVFDQLVLHLSQENYDKHRQVVKMNLCGTNEEEGVLDFDTYMGVEHRMSYRSSAVWQEESLLRLKPMPFGSEGSKSSSAGVYHGRTTSSHRQSLEERGGGDEPDFFHQGPLVSVLAPPAGAGAAAAAPAGGGAPVGGGGFTASTEETARRLDLLEGALRSALSELDNLRASTGILPGQGGRGSVASGGAGGKGGQPVPKEVIYASTMCCKAAV